MRSHREMIAVRRRPAIVVLLTFLAGCQPPVSATTASTGNIGSAPGTPKLAGGASQGDTQEISACMSRMRQAALAGDQATAMALRAQCVQIMSNVQTQRSKRIQSQIEADPGVRGEVARRL